MFLVNNHRDRLYLADYSGKLKKDNLLKNYNGLLNGSCSPKDLQFGYNLTDYHFLCRHHYCSSHVIKMDTADHIHLLKKHYLKNSNIKINLICVYRIL